MTRNRPIATPYGNASSDAKKHVYPGRRPVARQRANETNLCEVDAFVMTGGYEDQIIRPQADTTPQQLQDLHLKVVPVKAKSEAA